ncbi:hypothetical protein C3Y94_028040 [Rhizobium ruizarguesonis]|uniref:hypothetical protein n=1 Tax=Rhizobium ruizarguesonis TaxID=2081791 RepID=UPI0016AD97D9|nr:hypothetical protein [Rhizobium ruizarguesonis]MBC2806985.1 hypothetical protein [Rhizobium ruizarguesonis]
MQENVTVPDGWQVTHVGDAKVWHHKHGWILLEEAGMGGKPDDTWPYDITDPDDLAAFYKVDLASPYVDHAGSDGCA